MQAFQAICRDINDIARLTKSLLEELGSFYLVLDDQDLHCPPRADA